MLKYMFWCAYYMCIGKKMIERSKNHFTDEKKIDKLPSDKWLLELQ